MKSILVPTDFSKCSDNALQSALTLAAQTGAEVTVLHVIFPNEGVDNNIYNVFWSDEYMTERVKGLKKWVAKAHRLPVFKKVAVKSECRIGFPVPAICNLADEIHADLIVMGTTGATGLRGAFLGSIAAGVMSKTKRPLLSVPKQRIFDLTIHAVLATDFRFNVAPPSLSVLGEVLAGMWGKLHVVHILDKPGSEHDATQEKSVSDKLGGIPHDFHYLHDRDITQAVSNFIESVDAGLLVAVTHEHSVLHRMFFDSITRRFAHRIRIPLLSLHGQ